jgi:hypothetical protein
MYHLTSPPPNGQVRNGVFRDVTPPQPNTPAEFWAGWSQEEFALPGCACPLYVSPFPVAWVVWMRRVDGKRLRADKRWRPMLTARSAERAAYLLAQAMDGEQGGVTAILPSGKSPW